MADDGIDYALKVWDAVYQRAQTALGGPGGFKTFRRLPMLKFNPDLCPSLAVFFLQEERPPLGQANTGPVKFANQVHIGISALLVVDGDDAKLQGLNYTMGVLDNALFSDPKFMNMIEGVEKAPRQLLFRMEGESQVAEMRSELVFSFSSIYPPTVTDDLKTIHVDSRYPLGDTDTNIASRIQIGAVYDLEQE